MHVDEEDTARTPKKQKIENLGKLVQVAKAKGRKKPVKFKGPTFEIQEYTFGNIHVGTTDKYKSKTEFLNKYKDVSEIFFDEKMKLYDEVRKLFGQDVSLVTIRN